MMKQFGWFGLVAGLLLTVPVLAQEQANPIPEDIRDGVVIARFDDMTRPGELRFESMLEALTDADQPYVVVDQDLRTSEDAAQLADDTNAIATLDGYQARDGSLKMRLTWGTRGAQVLMADDNAVSSDVLEESLTLTADMEPEFVADYLRGSFFYAFGEDEDAISFLEKAYQGLPAGKELESEAHQLFLTYAIILNRFSEYDKALEVVDFAIELDKNFAYSYFVQARALRYTDRTDEALEVINKAITLSNNSTYYSELGRIYIIRQEYDEAKAAYDQALEISPDDPVALVGLGDTAYFEGDIEGSIPFFQQAAESDPTYSYAYYSSAYSYFDLNDMEKALEDVNKALVLDPDYADAVILLGDIQYVLGNKTEAAVAYQRYLDLGGNTNDTIADRIAEGS